MIILAPGASGGVERVTPILDRLHGRGLDGRAITLPRGSAERAIPAYRAELLASTGGEDGGAGGRAAVIGGQSFGGRVASLLAADPDLAERVGALVLLCYPLHAPGREATWDQRTEHWPRIACPVLLLSGESDPFARIERLRSAVRDRLHPDAQLVTYPGLGHSLATVVDDVADRVATFASTLDTGDR